MRRYKGDPRWLIAQFADSCGRCGAAIKAGERIFYYPQSPRGKRSLGSTCGHAEEAARDFAAHASDEDGY